MSHTESPSETQTQAETCFHCGLPVPRGLDLPIEFEGARHPACCAGCQAVAQSIITAGLGSYYHRRTAEAEQAVLPPPEVLEQLKLYDLPDVQAEFVEVKAENEREAVLMLGGVTCAACVWLIEQQLLRLPGVLRAEINYSTLRARVAWDCSQVALSDILLRVRQSGYEASPYDAQRMETQAAAERKQALTRLWVAGLAMMQVMPTYLHAGEIEPRFLWMLHWASMILTLPVLLYSAVPFFKGAWRDWKNCRAGMDTPVAISIAAAFSGSLWALFQGREEGIYFDSVSMFVFLLLGGRYLEQLARRKAGDAAERLVKLVPAFCHRLPDYPDTARVEEAVVAARAESSRRCGNRRYAQRRQPADYPRGAGGQPNAAVAYCAPAGSGAGGKTAHGRAGRPLCGLVCGRAFAAGRAGVCRLGLVCRCANRAVDYRVALGGYLPVRLVAGYACRAGGFHRPLGGRGRAHQPRAQLGNLGADRHRGAR